jgi:hypothetical protein
LCLTVFNSPFEGKAIKGQGLISLVIANKPKLRTVHVQRGKNEQKGHPDFF